MKIGILGGAFDPPHIGHLLVAKQTLEMMNLDEVWLMPCFTYFPEFPIKFNKITSFENRYTMASMYREKQMRVSTFEQQYNKKSRTINTMALLYKKYPNNSFYFIIGSDTLPTFYLWNSWKKLITDYNIVVFPRDTDFLTLETRVKHAFHLLKIPSNITVLQGSLIVSNIASTHIRKRIRTGLSVKGMIDEKVENYIKENKLYI